MDTGKIIELLIAALLGFVVHASLKFIKPKSKLVIWSPHNFLFQDIEPGINIHTQTYTIQNLGSDNAQSIEIVHRRKPDFFKLQPSLNYNERMATGGDHIITIDSLAPKEFFSLEILSYRNLPEFLYVRSKDGNAKPIGFVLQRTNSRWYSTLIKMFLAVGIVTTGYGVYLAASHYL